MNDSQSSNGLSVLLQLVIGSGKLPPFLFLSKLISRSTALPDPLTDSLEKPLLPTPKGNSKLCEDDLCGSPLRVRTQVRLDHLELDPLKTRLLSDPPSTELDDQRASSLVASQVDSKLASSLIQQATELILR